ncbi:hypothetical protein HI914_06756 [Erysiphe necator]|nr:hypothetical protein HI914_06756 [Erysiphe necator]
MSMISRRLFEPKESLQNYYQRALDILSRSHCRDEPLASSGDECLNPLEVVFSSGVIISFIEGINDPELRSNVLLKSSNTYRSLHGAYEAVKDTQDSMRKFREIETRLAEKRELEQFREIYYQGRNVTAASASFNQRYPIDNQNIYQARHISYPNQCYQPPLNIHE